MNSGNINFLRVSMSGPWEGYAWRIRDRWTRRPKLILYDRSFALFLSLFNEFSTGPPSQLDSSGGNEAAGSPLGRRPMNYNSSDTAPLCPRAGIGRYKSNRRSSRRRSGRTSDEEEMKVWETSVNEPNDTRREDNRAEMFYCLEAGERSRKRPRVCLRGYIFCHRRHHYHQFLTIITIRVIEKRIRTNFDK